MSACDRNGKSASDQGRLVVASSATRSLRLRVGLSTVTQPCEMIEIKLGISGCLKAIHVLLCA
jgi:hypothetical protein